MTAALYIAAAVLFLAAYCGTIYLVLMRAAMGAPK